MGYQLADGFAIDLGFFTIHLNIGGTFDENERYDPKKHPMSFRFSARSAMLKLQEDIEVIAVPPATACLPRRSGSTQPEGGTERRGTSCMRGVT